MRIRTDTVKEVVEEASRKMSDPSYSQVMVGSFVQEQTATAQYIGAHEDELGGTENVIHCIFHAAMLSTCFQRGNNRSIREMSFDDLNYVAGDDVAERLHTLQPAVHGYIEANVEDPQMRKVLYLIALAMEWVS